MPKPEIVWTPTNLRKIEGHGITAAEVEEVLAAPVKVTTSRSSGLPLAMGRTAAGRWIAVPYVQIDSITVYPVTAFDYER